MSDTCKVIFCGELQEGYEPEQVIAAFSEKFGVTQGKAEKLLKTTSDVVLKGGLNTERAEKYKKVLEHLGLVVRIEGKEVEATADGLQLEPMETDDDATLVLERGTVDTSVEACPKCGSRNMESGICQDCGVVAAKYLSIQSRLQEETSQAQSESVLPDPENTLEADDQSLEDEEVSVPERVPAGHGWAWIVHGWWHFKQNPVAWVLVLVIWIVLAMVVSLIPLLGGIVVNLLTPVITAGLMMGCRAQDDGEDFTVGHLFAGFSNNTGQLIMIGLIYFGAMILISVVMMGAVFSLLDFEAMQSQDPEMVMASMMSPGFIGILLVGTLLFIPLMMAYVFAPALVVLDDLKAFEAMKLSFSGCLKNLLPLTIYGLLAILLMILGTIPFGLGILIVIPILTASLYSAYQDIYYS